ncbi:MAG: amidohydrolase family protein [Nitrospirae bacterium]|nr:amidohydrolase family protein [Nitrospirota bacterium]
MRIDMHCHVVGNGKAMNDTDVFFNPDNSPNWFTRILYAMIEHDLVNSGAKLSGGEEIKADDYFDFMTETLAQSKEIDSIVLLAMDAPYDPATHQRMDAITTLYVSNHYLYDKVKELNKNLTKQGAVNKRFYFGASVNPNRADWKEALDYVINKTDAVLMKWIPSVQLIHIEGSHEEYYETLAESGLPLLCHIGPEYSFPEGVRDIDRSRLDPSKDLDRFGLLIKPVSCGVKVIAAHCASPVFPLIDRDETLRFYDFMRAMNTGGKVRLWSDTSALSLSTRIPFLREIVENFPPEWLLNGSDFPIPIDASAHMPLVTYKMTPKDYSEILKLTNPLDKDIRIKAAHGFKNNVIFGNTEQVLRMPLPKP